MNETKYYWILPIGDWSEDGHGHCSTYIVESEYPVENIREAYFKACEHYHLDFSNYLCADYMDGDIWPSQKQFFKNIGIDVDKIRKEHYDNFGGSKSFISFKSYIRILFEFIKLGAPIGELKLIELPSFQYMGTNSDGKHIGNLGYGLFID